MRVIISAGGTGGHLYPAIALANKLGSLDKGSEILFITGKSGLERHLVCDAGYAINSIEIHGFRRKISADFLKTAYQSQRGYRQAKSIISRFKPHIVVGFGGAVSFPVILAAARASIPTLIHEQNLSPGLTNSILSRYADVTAVSFEESPEHFGNAKTIVVTGNPIRSSLFDEPDEDGHKAFGLEPGRRTVLIFGGSQGAMAINTASAGLLPLMRHRADLNIFHITGENDNKRVTELINGQRKDPDTIVYRTVPYLEQMGRIYRISDLAVSRAGAGTIAELTAFGLPAVLIPYPYAPGAHQARNAGIMRSKGAAVIIENSKLDAGKLFEAIDGTLSDEAGLEDMKIGSRALGRPEAAADLARAVVSTANMREGRIV